VKCVICKSGEVRPSTVQAEIKLGSDRLLVRVQAEACTQCGEAYYSADVLRHLERIREEFPRKPTRATSIGTVYQLS